MAKVKYSRSQDFHVSQTTSEGKKIDYTDGKQFERWKMDKEEQIKWMRRGWADWRKMTEEEREEVRKMWEEEQCTK